MNVVELVNFLPGCLPWSGKSQNVVSFPWLEECGLFMLSFKIDFSVSACTALWDISGGSAWPKAIVKGWWRAGLPFKHLRGGAALRKLGVPSNSHLEQWELLSAHSF